MAFWIVQILNGLSFGMLIFLLAAGLSLIFGLMNIVNLAHGSFYMIGAYIGVFLSAYLGNYALSVIGGGVAVGLIGILTHIFLFRRRMNTLSQILLTLGCLFIISDGALWIWGGTPMMVPKPSFFRGTIQLGSMMYPFYRLLIILLSSIAGIFLCWFQEGTRYGAMIRAGVDDQDIAEAVGINIPLITTLVFGLGSLFAGLAGVVGGALIGVYPGVEFDILNLAIAVLIIGGLGSLLGAFVGSLIVGLADSFGRTLFPEISSFLLFSVVVFVLAIKPVGLFGRSK
jgi:branched-chain amino acid transport system permease protein